MATALLAFANFLAFGARFLHAILPCIALVALAFAQIALAMSPAAVRTGLSLTILTTKGLLA
jgi:hypothetical protein